MLRASKVREAGEKALRLEDSSFKTLALLKGKWSHILAASEEVSSDSRNLSQILVVFTGLLLFSASLTVVIHVALEGMPLSGSHFRENVSRISL